MMGRRKHSAAEKAVTWLSEEVHNDQNFSTSYHYYEKFQYKHIVAGLGDFVLVSNADAAEPDTEDGCDAAKILSLYEDRTNKRDPFRAKVQWFSKWSDLPKGCLNENEPIDFFEKEVVEDHRPFDTDVDIETFYKKCFITLTVTKDTDDILKSAPYHYICRYRLLPLGKRKLHLEPVLETERKALQLLSTPSKNMTPKTPKTPNSLIKRMGRVSISEKNWSVSKNDGTKLLLKRAILADKNDRDSPKKTPKPVKPETPKSTKKLHGNDIEDVLLELKVTSDDELPTLVIRKHEPSTPKRKTPQIRINNETPKKTLVFEDEDKDGYLTRSGRVIKNLKSFREEVSPVKRTPRRVRKNSSGSEEDFMMAPKTPKTLRTPKTPRTPRGRPSAGRTPRSVSKRILTSELTPTLHTRAHSVENIGEYTKENKSLPGRENQLHEILSFIRAKLCDGSSGCMYISGVPGTGKTATVNSALKMLKEDTELPEFQLVEVNGMRIAEPRQAFVQIYKQLTGKTVVWEQACSLLEKRFTNPGPRRTPTVLIVDELDALCNRRQDVIYSIMEWATSGARLTVVAVANTMDLPERMAARVASRLGLTRLSFPPYTHTQLQNIVAARLMGHIVPDAVQLVARKVAAVSGDARRALALCSRALELAGPGGAGFAEVQRALDEAAGGAAVRAIRRCSPAERLMLRAVAAEVERTGSDETTLSRALMTAGALVALDGRPYRSAHIVAPTPAQARAACARLAALKLLLLEPKPEPRLLLNVSADDVHYATKQITV
ncbi:origin recognition complex subunit 1 [Aricia agestis]|uniref:origin recognition complex subunit 1 n=1 Tax=Aricia agestis TaxID=91739 RepID=UPI001C20454C|nr:origin recognition complex subunit 1 [Aricia agestis]XP_041984785.1 origin recognition complex subunit 1 [Aricia agestis]